MARRLNRRWMWAGIGAGLVLLWFGSPVLLRHLSLFQVRRIEFSNVRYLPAARLLDALALDSSASVFGNHDEAIRRLMEVPGVAGASAGRRLPGTLIIEVVESEPIALVPVDDRMVLMDTAGMALPFDPVNSAPDLPVAEAADSLVALLLTRLKRASPGMFARTSRARRIGDDVVLTVSNRKVWFRPDADGATIRAVRAVEQHLESREPPRHFGELDGRFANQVVVRWSGS